MKIIYQICFFKLWMLMVRLSVPIPDQSLPLGTQVLLSLAWMIDVFYRLWLEGYYRRLCSPFMPSARRED